MIMMGMIFLSKTKKSGKQIAKRILLGILIFILALAIFTVGANCICLVLNHAKVDDFPAVNYGGAQLVPGEDEFGYTFTTDNDFKIVQLTDVHLGGGFMSKSKDLKAMNAVAAMVTAEKPDLVVVTGDLAYPVPFQAGTFNNKSSAKLFADLMEQLGVYWTLTFGNHDTEIYSYYTREKISDFYESDNYKYCLFTAGPDDVDGFGNNVITVKNSKGIITQALFCLDSHSYIEGSMLGIDWQYDNIHQNQIDWYSAQVAALNSCNAEQLAQSNADAATTESFSTVKSLAFFHIPLRESRTAWLEYVANGYRDTENTKWVYGTAGESGEIVYCGVGEDTLFETMLELGSTKGVFNGHDHLNNFFA